MGRADYPRARQFPGVDGNSRILDVVRYGDRPNGYHERIGNDLLVLSVRPIDRPYGIDLRSGGASTRDIFLGSSCDLGDMGVEFL